MGKNFRKLLFSTSIFIIMLLMNITVYAEGTAQNGQAPPSLGGGLLGMVLYFAVIIGFFYLIFYRPQKKRMKQEEEMRNSVQVGDTVIMTSGIIGKVINIKDDEVTIESGAARTQIKFTKAAIGKIEKKAEEKSDLSRIDEKKAELQRKLDEKKKAKDKE